MTTIAPGRSLTRETSTLYRGRPLVVVLYARCMDIYPKGKRGARFSICYDQVYEAAGKITARLALTQAAKRRVETNLKRGPLKGGLNAPR